MNTTYHLTVNIQTPKGMLETGSFFLGNSRQFAETIFEELAGSENLLQYPSIRLDLLSITDDMLPLCLKRIGCNLEQYTSNCRILTRELFRHFMFEEERIL
ncbi:hypothetical protein SAMN05444266_103543 [Chitinophaga jiangningensis]|uniref:Uncharacterized protein n=1 Tax=Chitinophaga jiangningensis TaxID=1419482 RepID=A0A1M7B6B4_9BACT|nr:hypothetical protein [Chitinophaga jiangningensis]SHL50484.1 hypothetical protein SAMN05444266_103543 [Chitinophaga jiangningensis]